MKRRNNKILIIALMLILIMGSAAGCQKKQWIHVGLVDKDFALTFEAEGGRTVSEILEEAEVTLGEKDITEPAGTEVLTGDTEILIKRYAAVTVTYEGQSYDLEFLGGRVQDAIDEAGIVLDEQTFIDEPLTDWLKPGQEIYVHHELSVNLTADGSTEHIYTEKATVGELLEERGLTLGKRDRINVELTDPITNNMDVTIQRVKVKKETKKQKIDFETEYQETSSLAQGQTQVSQEGEKGVRKITYRVTYVDGVEESRKTLKKEVIKEPVNEIILQGTYVEPEPEYEDTDDGEYGENGKKIVQQVSYDNCDGSGHGYTVIVYEDGSQDIIEY